MPGLTPNPVDSSPTTPLADLALLALVIAHGTDADLDPRETTALVRQLDQLADAFGDIHSGADLSDLVETAVTAYGTLSVRDVDEIVERLGRAHAAGERARLHAALVAVADADGVVHTMEKTVLRHIAQAWGLGGDDG